VRALRRAGDRAPQRLDPGLQLVQGQLARALGQRVRARAPRAAGGDARGRAGAAAAAARALLHAIVELVQAVVGGPYPYLNPERRPFAGLRGAIGAPARRAAGRHGAARRPRTPVLPGLRRRRRAPAVVARAAARLARAARQAGLPPRRWRGQLVHELAQGGRGRGRRARRRSPRHACVALHARGRLRRQRPSADAGSRGAQQPPRDVRGVPRPPAAPPRCAARACPAVAARRRATVRAGARVRRCVARPAGLLPACARRHFDPACSLAAAALALHAAVGPVCQGPGSRAVPGALVREQPREEALCLMSYPTLAYRRCGARARPPGRPAPARTARRGGHAGRRRPRRPRMLRACGRAGCRRAGARAWLRSRPAGGRRRGARRGTGGRGDRRPGATAALRRRRAGRTWGRARRLLGGCACMVCTRPCEAFALLGPECALSVRRGACSRSMCRCTAARRLGGRQHASTARSFKAVICTQAAA